MKQAVLTLLAFLPFTIGWVAGIVVTVVLWIVAAVVVGYQTARGNTS